MKLKKDLFITFILTFIINLSFIYFTSIIFNKSINTFIKFSSYDYEYVGIFDNLYDNNNSFIKTKSFYRIKSFKTEYAYLYFEKNVNYEMSPNIENSNNKFNYLNSDECAISNDLAKSLKVNIGDSIYIDVGNIEYIYKVMYLYNSDFSFYDSKIKDIHTIILGKNDNLSSSLDCHEIIFCNKDKFESFINDEDYSMRNVFTLKDELINSFLKLLPILICVILLIVIDFFSIKWIYYKKNNDFIMDFYSSFKINNIKKEYVKFYILNHICPCFIAFVISFIGFFILRVNFIPSVIYLLVINICFVFNYGGFTKKWKKRYF